MADKKSFSWELFNQTPVVGILRGLPPELVRQVAKAYLEAGFHTLEITMNTAGAPDMIMTLKREHPRLNVGAGTVCSMEDLEIALGAGAEFIVTPVVSEEVIKAAVKKGVPVFPGAFTPTEIYKAWSLGASAVKVFPATQLGVQYIKDVMAPLDTVKLLPTGGIHLANIRAYFEAGATGVGMASSLFDKKLLASGDFTGLGAHFREIKAAIKDFSSLD